MPATTRESQNKSAAKSVEMFHQKRFDPNKITKLCAGA